MGVSFIYPQYLWLLLLIPLTIGLAVLGRRALTRLRLWTGLALRVFLLLLIVFALAGIQLRLPADELTAVFLLDVSDSIPPEEQAQGEAFIRESISAMPNGDQAAIVVFGENALVERLASGEQTLPGLASVPVTTRTSIASAMQLALALLPDQGAKRLVLLSDGRENLSQAVEQAELAAMQGIELVYYPLGDEGQDAEVRVDSVSTPADVRQGQDFELTVLVHSSLQTGATLRVFSDDEMIFAQDVQLQEGVNRFPIPVEAGEAGFRRFRAQVIPDADNRLQNNEGSAFTVVHGPPSVLLVEGTSGEGENLSRALQAAEMSVTIIPAAQMPNTLPELAQYDAVILANVPATALSSGAMEALPVYVRELGKGLLMTGGQNSFGAGGYLRQPLEEALPVSMEVRSREMAGNLALVLAVDKSGSMGRCHCDDPDLEQTYERTEVGQPKVDIAKEAIMRSASALGSQDFLGVVTFDTQARWALQVNPLVDPFTIEQSIGGIQAEGQTSVRAGIEAAYEALEGVNARRKHIILMTDGWIREGDVVELAAEMQEKGITLSVVAAGGGSAEYLSELALSGGGTYYPAEDILSVPDIFLKETVQSAGEYIIEEPFFPLPAIPSPVLQGLDPATLPPLLGYNGTSPKNTARLDLITPRGDPLLASWQYGLGRAAVWTSDLKSQWATEWMKWEGFSRFAAQLVGWTMPAPQVEGLSAQVDVRADGQAAIRVNAVDDEERPVNFLDAQAVIVGPDLESQELPLQQVGAGQYEAAAPVSQPGTYLVRVGVNDDDQSLGQMTLGLVVPYSPEYKTTGVDTGLLGALASLTGGGAVSSAAEVFLHNLPAIDYAREIWRPLLLLAALLFPLDVALRRVMIGGEDLRRARIWLRERLQRRTGGLPEGERALGQLFEARQRARERQQGVAVDEPVQSMNNEVLRPDAVPPVQAAAEQPQADGSPSAVDESEGDALARLRAAKKRTRQDH